MGCLMNLLWLLLGGIFTAVEYLISSLLMMLTIIGIPFAWQHVKLAALALCPIGKTIVPAPVAQAAEEAATLRDYHGRR